jgi:hypothetical protein
MLLQATRDPRAVSRDAKRRHLAHVMREARELRDDAQQRCFESEEHARLNLRSAGQAPGLGHDLKVGGAKIVEESCERLYLGAGRDHAIVISSKGDDRRRIVAIRVIKLIIVVLRLTEIIDHVAQMEEAPPRQNRRSSYRRRATGCVARGWTTAASVYIGPHASRSFAMLMAIRSASSIVSIFACDVSDSLAPR